MKLHCCFAIVSLLLMNAATVQGQMDSLVCDVPYCGSISSLGETDFISFRVSANEIFSITIVKSSTAGTNFSPYWRILDRNGTPANSCGSPTTSRQADCGPLPTSGNPYRIEVTDFFNDATGNYCISLQRLTSAVVCEDTPLTCDVPFVGTIDDPVDSDLLSFSVSTNEIVSITIVKGSSAGTNFSPYWRVLDRNGNPAPSCGSRTTSRQADCGPLPTSGNPHRIEVSDFFNDAIGNYHILLQRLTAGTACETIPLKCDIPFTGTIGDVVDSDLLSFNVLTNERVRITILTQGGINFTPYWRILDATGKPAASCGSRTTSSQVDCGPLDPSGNPYRIEVSDFFNDGNGTYTTRFNLLTSICEPGPPILASPANGAINVPINPTLFSWNASDRATSYRLQISRDALFSPPIILDQSGIAVTSFSVNDLSYLANYFWRVNASNITGTSDWSDTLSFTTIIAPPLPPSLTFPHDDSSCVPTTLTLNWTASDRATSYQVQVDTDPNFSPPVRDLPGLTGTSVVISALANNTRYYWQVRAANLGGTSNWSNIRKFTTIDASPEAPTLLSPSDLAFGLPTDLTLKWNAVNGASSYQIQVSKNPNFSPNELDVSGITGTEYRMSGLDTLTAYYWRVRASNNCGAVGDWSSIWAFSTPVTDRRGNEVPNEFSLSQNYPNPFNPSTMIRYAIVKFSQVTLKVFNLTGQEVAILVNETKPAGEYQIEWNANNLPSGVYLYRLEAGEFVDTKKLLLLK